MSKHVAAFDHWIRNSFVEMNTELEALYFQLEGPVGSRVGGRNDKIGAGGAGPRLHY